jgi:hypothetical protein
VILALLACTATIRVNTNLDTAEIYVMRNAVPNIKQTPSTYAYRGKGDVTWNTAYWSWDEWWVWVGAPGYESQVIKVPQEVKIGPAVLAVFFCAIPAVWAYGPDDDQIIDVKLSPNTALLALPPASAVAEAPGRSLLVVDAPAD